jgi:hypothetical protein
VSEPADKPDAGADHETPSADSRDETALLDELLAERPAPAREPAGLRTRVGRLVEWTSGQLPKVEFEGNERGPLSARSIVPLDPTTIAEAIRTERGVLLTFEDGRPDAPIITGLLQDFVGEAPQIWNDPEPEPEPETNLSEAEARVDGRRIELEAADEIVLRCGQASITLRRNGRVVIRGTYVESRSRGVNRIKGGSVEIN